MKASSFAFPLLALAGCLPGASDPGGADATPAGDDAGATADATPGLPDADNSGPPDAAPSFHGTPPVSPKPVPMFSVLNRDGSTRTEADLIGHPTVIWFYPAAGTAG